MEKVKITKETRKLDGRVRYSVWHCRRYASLHANVCGVDWFHRGSYKTLKKAEWKRDKIQRKIDKQTHQSEEVMP